MRFLCRGKEEKCSNLCTQHPVARAFNNDVEQLPVHMKFAAPYVEKFHSICIRGSISPLRAAVGFVKSHQDIHYLVFGSDNERQLHEYLSIAAETLSPKVVNELNNEFDVVEERLVNPSLWNG